MYFGPNRSSLDNRRLSSSFATAFFLLRLRPLASKKTVPDGYAGQTLVSQCYFLFSFSSPFAAMADRGVRRSVSAGRRGASLLRAWCCSFAPSTSQPRTPPTVPIIPQLRPAPCETPAQASQRGLLPRLPLPQRQDRTRHHLPSPYPLAR